MLIHTLKTEPVFFNQTKEGKKLYEVRKFDRPYKAGDTVFLQEFDGKEFSGQELSFEIGFVLTNDIFEGVRKGWCVFSLIK